MYRLDFLDSLDEHEQTLQTVAARIEYLFRGFTIAYAELYAIESERVVHGGMRHVLVPEKSVQ